MSNMENDAVCIDMWGIGKCYGEKQILHNLNLTVKEGEFIAIMGKSGCGKSTLLNIIGLLDSYQEGTYRLFGKDIKEKGVSGKRMRAENIGFVFQAYCLLDNLSVEDNVLMPLLYGKQRIDNDLQEQMKNYFDQFRLRGLEHTKTKCLSGGEKQRVAIVRALLKNPRLIIADEPTGNLDPENAYLIAEQLRKLTNEGKTVVVVTHSPDYFQIADRHLMLEEGALYEK